MVFFKRLSRSRSRSNSQSYIDTSADANNYDKYDEKYAPIGSGGEQDHSYTGGGSEDTTMYNGAGAGRGGGVRPQAQQSESYQSQYASGRRASSSGNGGGYGAYSEDVPETKTTKLDQPAPDLLLQAFNMALRPYSDKIEGLESEIADLKAYVEALERQRGEVHAWIDKRGLRPDVPPAIAQIMDESSTASSPTHGAATLNAQLDRKITIVNFDLHRLQDDLNDSLPTPSFSACMLKFLPDIARLSALPSGPRHAFDLLLKLGGNLNSHGGLENGDEEDIAERRSFYGRLDEAMVEVVRGRFREEGDGWGVQREIKRIEKTGAYLRNWGVEPYFLGTLEVMREGSGGAQTQEGANGLPSYN